MRRNNDEAGTELKKGSRPGGRAALVVAAIHQATLALLEEIGYDRMEIPSIADRAQVNKTSIYRRWPNKAELVLDVLLEQTKASVPLPDTGSVREDLRLLLHGVANQLATPFARGLLLAFIGSGHDDPTIQSTRSRFWAERFHVSGKLVERAVARGELRPETNPRVFLELACSPLFFRSLVANEAISDGYIDALVELAVSASRPLR
ncbi:TetR family transcriptional regulator [Cupriavidus sp. SK-4]|uniref:TetR/AcrR family transcriptional regulator n=1 Tax=Cupriavidus sp. SK-4 TaxID=574750 RepID=UPI00044D1E7C|nr:TetR/AcrR family transcriptional regulator [Cupriavidus sp. SK-4]EYS85955.1 TetR family transcriptional regulator [Cupriavidus sp. SK-4]